MDESAEASAPAPGELDPASRDVEPELELEVEPELEPEVGAPELEPDGEPELEPVVVDDPELDPDEAGAPLELPVVPGSGLPLVLDPGSLDPPLEPPPKPVDPPAALLHPTRPAMAAVPAIASAVVHARELKNRSRITSPSLSRDARHRTCR